MQALATAKYVAMLSFTSLQRWLSSRTRAHSKKDDDGTRKPTAQPLPKPSSRARRLMVIIGLLDLVAYLLHCVGGTCAAAKFSCQIDLYADTGGRLSEHQQYSEQIGLHWQTACALTNC